MIIRIVVSFCIAFLIPVIIIPFFIKIQKKYNVGQIIRKEGPDLHQHKSGTPTMGGVIIILAVAFSLLCFSPADSKVYISFILLCSFGLVGFIDDLIKCYKGRSLGLKARNKIFLQLLISILFLFWFFQNNLFEGTILIPFKIDSVFIPKIVFIPLIILVFISTSNAVNLTDGLDGLATGLLIVAFTAFAVICFTQGEKNLGIFSLIIILSCSGFLIYNFHPAQIFLGDVGALGLGGFLAAIAIFSNTELFLLLIGGVFVIETLSVIIQVLSIQLYHKPIFMMSPLHHHFEMMKWKEIHIVSLFWGIGVIFAILGLIAYPF
jgi:phospho-N-acetylmuramoyl-pentapeptide-transferase